MTLPVMREMSVAEQRYRAVLAVIAEGRSVTEVAGQWRVSRQTLHAWLARYEAEGLEGLSDRSHRPVRCPHQMPAGLEARVLEMRRAHPFWGPRRILAELRRAGVDPVPSESALGSPSRRAVGEVLPQCERESTGIRGATRGRW